MKTRTSLVCQGFSDYCQFLLRAPRPPPFSRSKKLVFLSDTPWLVSEYLNILEEFHPTFNKEILMSNQRQLGLSKHLKSILEAMREAKWPECPFRCFPWAETSRDKAERGNYQIFQLETKSMCYQLMAGLSTQIIDYFQLLL